MKNIVKKKTCKSRTKRNNCSKIFIDISKKLCRIKINYKTVWKIAFIFRSYDVYIKLLKQVWCSKFVFY
ncbi:hypothetical protein A0H76_2328 [Hepatospora eriocheir]|uniref:Uncharacterized protein n=1 Tax=Hepatospora eriocheir TaxID=1081669 RepID=A0A1X0QFG7_9MICR|nr:hypothetical protein A0H76_2328 [Hepatospora eriocheir]